MNMQIPNSVFLIALAAHLPMFIGYSMIMWNKGHYQFFPLLMAVVGFMIFERVSKSETAADAKATKLATILLGLNILMLACSGILYSSFLIMPALIVLLIAFVTYRTGFAGLKKTLPVICLLVFIIPLPSGRDVQLINEMQFLTSQLASWILDAFSLSHFREGVILVTEKKQFFAEEACSGIRSLFSSMAAISIYGVARNYSIGRLLFNLAQTTVWVVVGNALRVALVVYLSDNWSEDFATGTTHEMLGLVAFVFIFLIAISTDRFIDSVGSNTQDEDLQAEVEIQPTTQTMQNNTEATRTSWILIGCFVCLLLFSGRMTYAKLHHEGRFTYDEDALLKTKETDLPTVIGDWKVNKFEHLMRNDASLFAPESFIWTLESRGRILTISLDSPYPSFHDLTYCYRGQGWATDRTHDYGENLSLGISQVRMKKNGNHGYCIFSAVGKNGKTVLPDTQLGRTSSVMSNLQLVLGIGGARSRCQPGLSSARFSDSIVRSIK